MTTISLAAPRRSLISVVSRRGVLAGLLSGLLATGPFGRGDDAAVAKKKGKRKKQRRRRKQRKNQKPRNRIDATCTAGDDLSIFSNDNGTARLAQTFTAIASGELIVAEVDLFKDAGSSGDYILRLSPVDEEEAPTNDVLAETTFADADVVAGSSIVPFTFADPPAVAAGVVYALVLTRPGGEVAWNGSLEVDACVGQAFDSLDQTAPFTRAGNVGADFSLTTVIRT